MAQKTLQDAFIDEIRDIYDAERQLTRALPKLAKAATTPELKQAFTDHLAETENQIERLEKVFEALGERARGKRCEGMAGIIEEGSALLEEEFDEASLDAALIAAGQRAEHYEMATYGTLVAWARELGHMEVGEFLQQNLDEEKAADEKLSSMAEGGVNQEAATAFANGTEGEEEDEGEEERSTARSASKRSTSTSSSRSSGSRSASSGSRSTSRKR